MRRHWSKIQILCYRMNSLWRKKCINDVYNYYSVDLNIVEGRS